MPLRGKKAIEDSRDLAEAELHRIMVEIKGGESVDALLERLLEALDKLPASEQQFRRIAIADRLRQGITATLTLEEAWEHISRVPNETAGRRNLTTDELRKVCEAATGDLR